MRWKGKIISSVNRIGSIFTLTDEGSDTLGIAEPAVGKPQERIMIANGYLVDWPDTFERRENTGLLAGASKSLPAAGLTVPDGVAIGQSHLRTDTVLPLASSIARDASETVDA